MLEQIREQWDNILWPTRTNLWYNTLESAVGTTFYYTSFALLDTHLTNKGCRSV